MEMGLADRIANEVDIIVNSAATTTFNERYDVALDTNTLGPFRVLSFAKRCKALRLFLHVSTAYVYGPRQGIALEKPLYMGDSIAKEIASLESPMRSFPLLDIEAEVKLALEAKVGFGDQVMTQKMRELGMERAKYFGWHDVYVFTKAMGEMMIESERENIPTIIIRPSMIESTFIEPVPGWIEGIRLIDPIIVSYGKGELTGFPVKAEGIIDLVPADMVVNAILASMVKCAIMRTRILCIYHVASSNVNSLVIKDLVGYIYEYFCSSPSTCLSTRPRVIQRMELFNSFDDFCSHLQTKAFQESIKTFEGEVLSISSQLTIEKAMHIAKLYESYAFYEGRFDISNTEKLLEEMSQDDKNMFGFDVRNINWKNYICKVHIPGLLKYVVKEKSPNNLISKL